MQAVVQERDDPLQCKSDDVGDEEGQQRRKQVFEKQVREQQSYDEIEQDDRDFFVALFRQQRKTPPPFLKRY